MAKFDHSWGNYHWATNSLPFTIKLGDNLNSTWKPYMGVAIQDWNVSQVLDTVAVAGSVNPKRCNIVGGMAQVCNERYGRTGWLGVAGISVSSGHITGAYVKLNDSYAMTTAEKQLVTCQEIGHVFGLGHQDENFYNAPLGTCMDYTQTSNANQNMHPNAHDYQWLENIYSHTDGFTTISAGAVSPQVAFSDFRSPRAWGRPINFNAQGQPILFVRQYPTGEAVYTHIYPVPGSRYADEEHEH
jgi:hypothetical protein